MQGGISWWPVVWAMVCAGGGLLVLADNAADPNWRTVSASGKRYLNVHPPLPNASALAAAAPTQESDKSVGHSSPIATSYYPSRKDPSQEVSVQNFIIRSRACFYIYRVVICTSLYKVLVKLT